MAEPIKKPTLSLSLDLDNKWSYLKTQGDSTWESHPSYLDQFVEIALPLFQRYELDMTVFIVGQDAALDKNRSALRAIAFEGFEIGNHSFSHEPWFHRYDRDRITNEISQSSHHIESVTGQKPVGFRGPGFCHSTTMLEVLSELDYEYDASQFPTFLGPLARFYFFCNAGGLSDDEKKKRASLFGKFSDGFQSLRPYRHLIGDHNLIEMPVTTMPIFKLPFHQSYINYLACWNETIAMMYARSSFSLCRTLNITPSFLLHPLDFLGGDDIKGMDFFPGMQLTTKKKCDQTERTLDYMANHFSISNMRSYCNEIDTPTLPQRIAN